jgi:hypothetical protein
LHQIEGIVNITESQVRVASGWRARLVGVAFVASLISFISVLMLYSWPLIHMAADPGILWLLIELLVLSVLLGIGVKLVTTRR